MQHRLPLVLLDQQLLNGFEVCLQRVLIAGSAAAFRQLVLGCPDPVVALTVLLIELLVIQEVLFAFRRNILYDEILVIISKIGPGGRNLKGDGLKMLGIP